MGLWIVPPPTNFWTLKTTDPKREPILPTSYLTGSILVGGIVSRFSFIIEIWNLHIYTNTYKYRVCLEMKYPNWSWVISSPPCHYLRGRLIFRYHSHRTSASFQALTQPSVSFTESRPRKDRSGHCQRMRSKYWSHCRLLSATINNDFLFFAKRWYLRSSLRMYVRPSVVYIYICNYICVYTYILYIYIYI